LSYLYSLLYRQLSRRGEHIAWGESSAIAFANSVLGAFTNREGGPSALAAALTGCVPEYGYHLAKTAMVISNQCPAKLDGIDDLGHGLLGRLSCGSKVPVFTGISDPSTDELKMLGATGFFRSRGALPCGRCNPEAPTCEALSVGGSRSKCWTSRRASWLTQSGPQQTRRAGNIGVCMGATHVNR